MGGAGQVVSGGKSSALGTFALGKETEEEPQGLPGAAGENESQGLKSTRRGNGSP